MSDMSEDALRKRASPASDEQPPPKRQRTDSSSAAIPAEIPVAPVAPVMNGGAVVLDEKPNEYHVNRTALQRSISLALDHVGFDCASGDAMESFTLMTETCQSFVLTLAYVSYRCPILTLKHR